MLASSVWFLYARLEQLKGPHNPHFHTAHCFDCHEPMGSKMTAVECFNCHDSRTRELLPGAVEKRLALSPKQCSHPLKSNDPIAGRTPTQLCLSCHPNASGYVVLANVAAGIYAEFDMTATHPIGTMPTNHIFPKSLPLDKKTGAINCVTCHDPHGVDPRMRLLRYFYPGNGRPPSYTPLCNDCHPDEWMALKLKRKDIIRGVDH